MNANFESHSISRRSFLKASGVVGAASILAACGGSSSSTAASTSGAASGAAAPAADAITDYVSFETANRELETWNFLYSQSASDLNVTTNCWDGLLSFDCYGKAVPPPSHPAGSTTRTPPSGPSTCATMSIGATSTARSSLT